MFIMIYSIFLKCYEAYLSFCLTLIRLHVRPLMTLTKVCQDAVRWDAAAKILL